MLSRYNDKFGEILKPILFLFERSFCSIRKQYDENIMNLRIKLNSLEEDFAKYKKEKEMIIPSKNDRIPNNQFGLMDITVKVVGNKKKGMNKNAQTIMTAKKAEEKVDVKEIGFQNQILDVNQTLEVLRQSMNLREDKFFSSLGLVILVYPFSRIEEFYKKRICSIREDSFSALLNSFERLCNKIITNSSIEEPIDKSSIEKYFHEIKTNGNEICNDFFVFQAYLQLFKELLTQSANEVPLSDLFMYNLFNAATRLLEGVITQEELTKQDNFCDRLENFAHNVSKLLLTYSISQHFLGKYSKDHLKVFNEWLRIIFEAEKYAKNTSDKSLVSQDSVLFKDIVSLLQFGSSFESNAITFFKEENSVLKTLLCKENNIHWDMATASSITFVLDNLLRDSIFDEVAREVMIKKALLQGPVDLAQLIEHIPSVQQTERLGIDTLAPILKTKFKLSLDPQEKDQKLYVSIGNILS